MKRHILDEQVCATHTKEIQQRISSVVKLGIDWGASGWDDIEQVIPHLHGSKATFHTLDEDFFKRRFLHPDYCLVYYDVPYNEFVDWVVKWLHHPRFNTHAKRMGTIVKVLPIHITYWDVADWQIHEVQW